jgi:hypothetical protein
VDGDYVAMDELLIRGDQFTAADLEAGLDLGRGFDLVISLEVAEHLSSEAADGFVASLVRHSTCILFSAAVPHQGGFSHVNEQWQSFWAEKFARHRFRPWDFRGMLWGDAQIEPWYVQNMLLYIQEGLESKFPALADLKVGMPRDVVHPAHYLKTVSEKQAVERKLWHARTVLLQHDASMNIPAHCHYVLLDDGTLSVDREANTGVAKRVVEENGTYRGAPASGQEAVAAIHAHRREGARFLLQSWLAFWWQEAYEGLGDYLEQEAECLVDNEWCRIFRFQELPSP